MIERIPLNWGLLKQPTNWATVVLIVLIFGVAVEVLLHHFSKPAA